MLNNVVNTERLLIREFDPQEDGLYLNLHTDPAVTEYINKRSDGELRPRFAEGLEQYHDGTGLGRWAIFNKEDGDFIGVCRLKLTEYGPHCAELGYVLHQNYWGKGIAREMAKEIVGYVFKNTAITEIIAVTMLPNIASQRVLEKTGFARGGNIVREGRELAFFKLLKDAR